MAGIILLWFKDIARYKFGASDERFMHLRVNQLLMWKAIQLAQDRCCQRFDFGRANCANSGLAQYKNRWGTQKIPLHCLRMPNAQKCKALIESSNGHVLLKKIMMRTPEFVISMSGELLYKHLA